MNFGEGKYNMLIIFNVIEYAADFIEFFIIYSVLYLLFRKSRKRKWTGWEILFSFMGSILIMFCNYISTLSTLTMAMFVAYTWGTSNFLYSKSKVDIFSVICFYSLCVGMFDFFVLTVASTLFKSQEIFLAIVNRSQWIRIIYIICVKGIWIGVYLKIKGKLYNLSLKKNYTYTVFIISCLGYIGFVYLYNKTITGFVSEMSERWIVFIGIISFLLFFSYSLFRYKEEKMRFEMINMRNELLEKNYQSLSKMYEQNAKLFHDLNNHLNVLYQLLNNNAIAESKQYITNISEPIRNLSSYQWTGMEIVDVIINSKLAKAKELHIEMEINVEFPYNTNIMEHDLGVILINLLDNAIEATENLKENKIINLTIRKINYFMIIQVSNPVFEKISFIKRPKTTKDNKLLHGWGLSSVESSVEKYNGTVKYDNSDGLFTATVMLFYKK
ncbi:GHKL domain-containing protein [Lachnospiraceae bacterium MD308]|nr:GHKL domain-containing protein [Lachnospiraceae bacterium MD308]